MYSIYRQQMYTSDKAKDTQFVHNRCVYIRVLHVTQVEVHIASQRIQILQMKVQKNASDRVSVCWLDRENVYYVWLLQRLATKNNNYWLVIMIMVLLSFSILFQLFLFFFFSLFRLLLMNISLCCL